MNGHLVVPAAEGAKVGARWDLFVVLLGAPYGSDGVSTALRWSEAAASAGARVQVWTCGYATLLTQRALGATKPPNPFDRGTDVESSATWAQRFMTEHGGRTRWLVCRFCGEERGAVDHVEGVRVRPSMAFVRHVRESTKTVLVGVI